MRAVVPEDRHRRELVVLDVLQRRPNLHHEVRRFHLGRGGQVLQDELVALLQPEVDPPERLVVERPDPQQPQVAVVDVQHLRRRNGFK